MSIKSIKNWKMEQLLREFAPADNNTDLKGVHPDRVTGAAGFMGNRPVTVSGGEKNQLARGIKAIHDKNNENPIDTLSDVIAIAFSVVGGMGTQVRPADVKDFIQNFIMSQAGEGEVG